MSPLGHKTTDELPVESGEESLGLDSAGKATFSSAISRPLPRGGAVVEEVRLRL